jgi:hypothetical protein
MPNAMDITGWTQIIFLSICMLALASMHTLLEFNCHRINARIEALEARLLKLEAWQIETKSGAASTLHEFLETRR